MFNQAEQAQLVRIAQHAVSFGVSHACAPELNICDYPPSLQVERATFVTLEIEQQLRGCIGTLTPHQSVVADVSHNAYAAAFRDHRFPPVSIQEVTQLRYHLSILNPAEPMHCSDEQALLQSLRPGIDGLVLEDGLHHATFLPTVWESLPTPQEFLRHLKQKAGLPDNYWSNALQFKRYTVDSIHQ